MKREAPRSFGKTPVVHVQQSSNSIVKRRLAVKPTLLCAFLFALLALRCNSAPPEEMTDPGELLYWGYLKKDVNCVRCHGPEGAGGDRGSDLRNVFQKYEPNKVVEIIKHGKGEGSHRMPAFENKVSAQEMEALLRFLETLQITASTDH